MDFEEVKTEERQGLESVGEAGAGEAVSFNHGESWFWAMKMSTALA